MSNFYPKTIQESLIGMIANLDLITPVILLEHSRISIQDLTAVIEIAMTNNRQCFGSNGFIRVGYDGSYMTKLVDTYTSYDQLTNDNCMMLLEYFSNLIYSLLDPSDLRNENIVYIYRQLTDNIDDLSVALSKPNIHIFIKYLPFEIIEELVENNVLKPTIQLEFAFVLSGNLEQAFFIRQRGLDNILELFDRTLRCIDDDNAILICKYIGMCVDLLGDIEPIRQRFIIMCVIIYHIVPDGVRYLLSHVESTELDERHMLLVNLLDYVLFNRRIVDYKISDVIESVSAPHSFDRIISLMLYNKVTSQHFRLSSYFDLSINNSNESEEIILRRKVSNNQIIRSPIEFVFDRIRVLTNDVDYELFLSKADEMIEIVKADERLSELDTNTDLPDPPGPLYSF